MTEERISKLKEYLGYLRDITWEITRCNDCIERGLDGPVIETQNYLDEIDDILWQHEVDQFLTQHPELHKYKCT